MIVERRQRLRELEEKEQEVLENQRQLDLMLNRSESEQMKEDFSLLASLVPDLASIVKDVNNGNQYIANQT